MKPVGEFDEARPRGAASTHARGANRRSTVGLKVLMAAAGMQGLADGYFIVPNTIADELARKSYK